MVIDIAQSSLGQVLILTLTHQFLQYPTVIGQNSNIGHRIYLFVFSVLGDYCAYVTVGIGKRGLESTPRMDV